MRKAFLLSLFVLLSPPVLAVSFSLLFLLASKNNLITVAASPRVAYAALPVSSGTLKSNIVIVDARKIMVRNFFIKYKSDLLPYADLVVDQADEYNLDYRLIPAIAMQESNLCKKAPKNSNNCWGFGIYGARITRFKDYAEAIKTVTKTLARAYKANGLETPDQIMKRYTPQSNGSWANGVNHFMNALAVNL
jgi:hypothetical protein